MLRNLVRKARRGRGPHNNLMIIVRFAAAVARRAGAFFCSLLLLVTIALFPVRARATLAAGALTAVGFAVTVTAFLNLAGIYPFNPDTGEGLTFPEWTDDALQKLIDLYNVAHASAPLTRQTIKSYALGATIAVANEGWNRLRNFVDWIKTEYAPADNAQGVQLGLLSSGLYSVPVAQNGGVASWMTSNALLASVVTEPDNYLYFAPFGGGNVYLGLTFVGSDTEQSFVWVSSSTFGHTYVTRAVPSTSPNYRLSNAGSARNLNFSYDGITYTVYYIGYRYASILSDWDIPVYDSLEDFAKAVLGLSHVSSFSGITADTATVTTPAEPAADSEFTGMQVAGLGQGATVDALEDVIESGVQEREQPTVRQVEVEVQAGTEVDSETGEVTENPVVVTPSDVPVVAENYVLPASITTVFPFSIPWDVMRVFQALNAEPQRIDVTVTLPFPDVALDNEISFQVVFPPDELEENETFQAFMTWFRRVILIVMCVYATWGLASFIKR